MYLKNKPTKLSKAKQDKLFERTKFNLQITLQKFLDLQDFNIISTN